MPQKKYVLVCREYDKSSFGPFGWILCDLGHSPEDLVKLGQWGKYDAKWICVVDIRLVWDGAVVVGLGLIWVRGGL